MTHLRDNNGPYGSYYGSYGSYGSYGPKNTSKKGELPYGFAFLSKRFFFKLA